MSEKTALVLGGGGSRGAYEVGAWQALREMDVEIHMVCGASVGSMNGAVVAQGLFEEAIDFWRELETQVVFDLPLSPKDKPGEKRFDLDIAGMPLEEFQAYLKEFLTAGGANHSTLKKLLSEHLDEEAIRKSPIDFGLVTVEAATMQPKYFWKDHIPKGQILDYILASSSCFPAIQTYKIGAVTYVDGGYADKLPMGMALARGATKVIAVDLDSVGVMRHKALIEGENIIHIQSAWDLGNFLIFDRKNTKHIMRLGYLDTLKAYGAYDGSQYCFLRGQMDKRSLKSAETAARIFEINPEYIYSKESFHTHLADAVLKHRKQERQSMAAIKKDLSPTGLANLLKNRKKEDLFPVLNRRSLLLVLAGYLAGFNESEHETSEGNPLLNKALSTLFVAEAGAAHYLIKEHLV